MISWISLAGVVCAYNDLTCKGKTCGGRSIQVTPLDVDIARLSDFNEVVCRRQGKIGSLGQKIFNQKPLLGNRICFGIGKYLYLPGAAFRIWR